MGRKNHLRIAGVIENMSVFVDDTGREHHLFGTGGGDRLADEAGVPLLGRIPIEEAVADGGDHGRPIALGSGPASEAFRHIARTLIDAIVPPADLAGCSARTARRGHRRPGCGRCCGPADTDTERVDERPTAVGA